MSDCTQQTNGLTCPTPSDWVGCRPWDITKDRVNCYADAIANEALQIAGAVVNVYKLLGVHEQTKLIDLTGNGTAISGGDAPNYPAANAFTTLTTEWRSQQTGAQAVLASAYIGYDFGPMKLANGRQRYGVDAPQREHITTIKIKQSTTQSMRVSKVRVERSDDGQQWYGVAILTLPDNSDLNTVHFKQSVPSRYWRFRPLAFAGAECDSWAVQALEMHDYALTHGSNIQDFILLENRDRDYASDAVTLKGTYELMNAQTDLTRFGIDTMPTNYQIRVNFNTCVGFLGRPIVIGDILEIPSETQYTPDLKPIKRWLEVTDVTWDSASFTPGWQPTTLLITAVPAVASQETRDIFGDIAQSIDSSGLFATDDGNDPMYQDFSTIDQAIAAEAKKQVPEKGSEGSNTFREFEPEELNKAKAEGFPSLAKMNFNRTGMYVEDAIPQNGEKYTEGPTFPLSPANGNYHRLTYEGLAKDIPARLFRWSATKNKWLYLETDRRAQYDGTKPQLQEYTSSPNKQWANKVK